MSVLTLGSISFTNINATKINILDTNPGTTSNGNLWYFNNSYNVQTPSGALVAGLIANSTVTVTSITHNQVLIYESKQDTWINYTISNATISDISFTVGFDFYYVPNWMLSTDSVSPSNWTIFQKYLRHSQSQEFLPPVVYTFIGPNFGQPVSSSRVGFDGLVYINIVNYTFWYTIDFRRNPPVFASYAVGSALSGLSDAYYGSIVGANGRMYLCPNVAGNTSVWHYINTLTTPPTLVSYPQNSGYNIPNNQSVFGGVMGPSGRLYLTPYNVYCSSTVWVYIDTTTTPPNVISFNNGIGANFPTQYAFLGGTIDTKGRIFYAPYGITATQTIWYYLDTSNNTLFSYTNSVTAITFGAYNGGTLDSFGRIFFTPYQNGNSTIWHYVDTTTSPPLMKTYSQNSAPGINTQYSRAGIYCPSGRIFFAPSAQSKYTYFHYIDVRGTTPVVVSYPNPYSSIFTQAFPHQWGSITVDGKIICQPRDSSVGSIWMYIDTMANKPLNSPFAYSTYYAHP